MAATVSKGYVCPVIFLNDIGEPLQFFLQSSTKDKLLRNLIEKGGGCVSNKAKDSDKVIIKLADPSQGEVKGFVSTDFIKDSIKQQVAQDPKKYRLDRRFQPRFTYTVKMDEQDDKKSSSKIRRKKYNLNDDMKIVKYVKEHASEEMPVGGNVLWKQMEKQQVTGHSWQSMQKHFKVFLQDKMYQNSNNLQASLTLSRVGKPQGRSTPSKSKDKPSVERQKPTQISKSPAKKAKISETTSSSREEERDSPRKQVPATKTRATAISKRRDLDDEGSSSSGSVRQQSKKKKKKTRHINSDSSVDGFDEHLMTIAGKKTKTGSHVNNKENNDADEEQIDEDDDDDTDDSDSHDCETSAKDTQDEDDVPLSSIRKNAKSRYSSRSPHTNRQQSSSPSKGKTKTQNSNGQKSPPSSLNPCTSQLFDNEAGSSSNAKDSPPRSAVAEKSNVWQVAEEHFKKLTKVTELPCAKDLTRAQIIHVLYVTSGSLQDAKHFIETGQLSNGQSPWSPEEDDVILSDDVDAKKILIKKRNSTTVIQRKRFLMS